jgi:histidinol phosphatase-like enzyme
LLTGNPRYSYSNVGIGMSLKSAEHVLNPGVVEQSKSTSIYFVRQAKSTIVIVANQKGVVQQIGIADNRATANSKLMLALAGSVTGSVAVIAPQ